MERSKTPLFNKNLDISYYFQQVESVDLEQLQMTPISLYSTTPWRESNFITRTILNFYNGFKPTIKPLYDELPILTDSTANCGGNTISFHLSHSFKKINSVEIDTETFNMLKNNLNTYHLPTNNVYCCDYLSIYKNLQQDVIFIDPPWNGKDYIKVQCLDLYLSNINIIDICFDIITSKMATLIVLKLPVNYNLPQLINKLPNRMFLTHKIYRWRHHSYNVVFCW